MAEQGKEGKVQVRVALRVRPVSAKETARGVSKIVRPMSGHRVAVELPLKSGGERVYNLDQVFGPSSSQAQLFEAIGRPVVDEVLRGFNSTVFAYGQTGSGKTHTIEGTLQDPELGGLLPRCVEALFEATRGNDATLRVAALELYNEEIFDLLSDGPPPQQQKGRRQSQQPAQQLRLYEASDGTIQVKELREELCASSEEAFAALARATKGRRVAATQCNDRSSRSHAIYQIKVVSRGVADDGREVVTNGQLNVVDLAGSECVGKSGAREKRAREAGQINQSLLTLGRVITTLTSAGNQFVPYRDSKLTRLLQDSLGGKTLTTLIANVSPAMDAADETTSTLQYACRARSIVNTPLAHTRVHGAQVLKGISQEVDELRALLRAQRDKAGCVMLPNDKYDAMVRDIQDRDDQLETLRLELESRESKIDSLERARDEDRALLKASRACEDALRRSETQLVNGATLVLDRFKSALADLDGVLDFALTRVAEATEDARRADDLNSLVLSKNRDLQHMASATVSSLEDVFAAAIRSLDAAKKAADGAAADLADLAGSQAEKFAAKIRADAGFDVETAEAHAGTATLACDAAASTSSRAAVDARRAAEIARNATKALADRVDRTSSLVDSSLTQADQRATEFLDAASESHRKAADQAAACVRDQRQEIADREDALSRDRAFFAALCDDQRQWIADVSNRLRETVDRELRARLATLDEAQNQAVAAAARDAANLAAGDRDRAHRLNGLVNSDLPSLDTLHRDHLETLRRETDADVRSALDDLPTSTQVEAVASDVDAAVQHIASRLETSAADIAQTRDALVRDLCDGAAARAAERDAFAADALARVEKAADARVQALALDLHSARAEYTRAEDTARPSVAAAADAVRAAATTLAASAASNADVFRQRDASCPPVDRSGHENVVRGANFHPAPCRDALLADHYASVASAKCATLPPKTASGVPVVPKLPLGNASNRH